MYINEVVNYIRKTRARVNFVPVYIFWTSLGVITGVEGATTILDIFVPLVGRMGSESPGEIIVAVISSFLVQNFLPTAPAFYHRFSSTQRKRIVGTLLALSIASTAIFASPAWSAYDDTHPKRLGVQHVYNTTSGQTTLHIAQVDIGPQYKEFMEQVYHRYGVDTLPVKKGEQEEWDLIFPVSAFINSEYFPLISPVDADELELPVVDIKVTEDSYDEVEGTRSLTVDVSHVSCRSSGAWFVLTSVLRICF